MRRRSPRPSPPGLIRRLRRAERGSVAPLMGFALIALIGVLGFAVDLGRAYMVHARLANALDAAGLAVGARLSTTDYSADARKYVDANFDGYAGATVTEVTAVANANKSLIKLTGTATLPTAFMHMFGQDLVTVGAATEVVRASPGLELALVLDNTGSMRTEMAELKKAAKDLLDIVYGDADSQKNLYVGLAPFSQAVNIGSSRLNWTTGADSYDWGTTAWHGCVEERLASLDMSDVPPNATSKFKPYYWTDSGPLFAYDDKLENDWARYNLFPFKRLYRIQENYLDNDLGPNKGCPTPIIALTKSKAALVAGINAMQAVGATHVNVGAAWGWRILSPRWRTYWGGDADANNLPLDYHTKGMSKAVVIMTDGDNTTYKDVYTAYGMLSDLRLITSLADNVFGGGNAALDSRLAKVCNDMKTAGIIIYTVAFNNPSKATKTLLRNCASNTDFYFDSGNAAALSTAFRTIGDSLSNLRVSK